MSEKKNGKKVEYYPGALTIAGSDSGGGAGIQADLRTFNALGVFGCAAVTAVTAQNPACVTRIDPIPAAGVAAQIDAVMERIAVRCAKTGMLFTAENVRAVAAAVKRHKLKLICDPVMVSTSGHKLMEEEALNAMKEELLPLAAWITPNLPEGEFLLGKKFRSSADYAEAARELAELFHTNVLLKGGHDDRGKSAVDYVCCKGELYTLSAPRLKLPPYAAHGTGCTLSAAMAALTALNFPWRDMLKEAKAFVFGSLREHVEIGAGVSAMYPPVEDSLDQIVFAGVPGKAPEGRGRK